MQAQTIRTALGQLQEDPESEPGWASLGGAIGAPDRDIDTKELLHLFAAARARHAERGEWEAVARLLEHESSLAEGTEAELAILRERARVLREDLFDEAGASAALQLALAIAPSDQTVVEALEDSEGKRQKWRDLVSTYLTEAEQAPDDVYKSSMLMRAAEMELRFAGESGDAAAMSERLEHAVRLDPTNVRAGKILERLLRQRGMWADVARVLERVSDRAETPKDRIEAGVKLGRLYARQLDDSEGAARAYSRVLKDRSDHAEAMTYLTELYIRAERWDDLVALYERDLKSKDLTNPERVGDMLQIAMLLWRKAGRGQDAETWFERIARLEPAQPIMLDFYREYTAGRDDQGRLMDVLGAAQRSMKDGPEKTAISSEIARLAEGQANAQKAIEQYKGVLRQDPDNAEAREALKRLYKQTQGHNALVELLRQQLERTDQNDYQTRIGILREVAGVYRSYLKSDTALVSVLNQIVQLDEKLDAEDVEEVRELVHLYEKLGRWRDLLTNQLKLAEIVSDPKEKVELYRAVARRWLEQFSNVQNATDAYEALLAVDATDNEARERLAELYRKRRAWPALYELYEKELATTEGNRRIPILMEMAQLAAERLNRGAEAVELYKKVLEIDPSRVDVLDSLERHAERSKDWITLADVLEKRVNASVDDAAKLVVLSKLGGVYAEHIGDQRAAASAWRRVLELQPGHARALRVLRDAYLSGGDYDSLEALYASQNDWEGLAEVLSTAADRSKDESAKVQLSYRAASVFENQLGQPDRAFRSYERVLAANPTDERAARALIPLYEGDEKWARLPALYELLIEHAGDSDEKLGLLRKLVDVTSGKLSDKKAAAGYARRAFELAPGNQEALTLLEDTTRAAGAFSDLAAALELRLSTIRREMNSGVASEAEETGKKKRKKREEAVTVPDAASARGTVAHDLELHVLSLKLGQLYAGELGRLDDAVSTYKALLERDPSDNEAASALEAILRREDRRDELRWLLDLRVTNAPADDIRVRILTDWAVLEEEVFGTPENAVDLYRRVLDCDGSDRTALRALPRLLLAQNDAAGAAVVIERHRDQLAGEERAARDVELAELYLTKLDRHLDALEEAVRALENSPGNARAMTVLEQLMEREETKARAAEVLAGEYASGGDGKREAQALAVRLDQTKKPAERKRIYQRLADVHEEVLSAYGSALDVMLRAAREFPSELALWDRADALAALAGRPTDLAEAYREVLRAELPRDEEIEICERAARLHEDKLGDPIGATPYLERVLKLNAGNEAAFTRLKDILTAAERWGELEGLYDRAADATSDTGRRIEMFVEVALVCEEIIDDAAKATRYYERILEIDSAHDAAVHALDRLYVRQERHESLAKLLEGRCQNAVGDELLELKLRLARLDLDRLHQPERAIDHVEDVLRERPNDYDARELGERLLDIGVLRGRAARMLEAVYEARDEMRDLARVLNIRLDVLDESLRESGDKALGDERKELLRRIAHLRDERLHDDEGAFEALARLVPDDPLDTDARERLLEIGRRMGVHSRVAEVLGRSAEAADTPGLKGEILMKVAAIYEDLLDDASRAEATYRQVLAFDETDAELVLPAARALERIYLASHQPARLAEVLGVQVKLEQDSDKRRELLGRLGELYNTTLNDPEGAIRAWSARLDENPSDELALASLDKLYESGSKWQDLVGILERRKEITDDSGLRRKLMVRAAEVLSNELKAVAQAIDAWRSVVDEFGSSMEGLIALEKLYQSAERWDELAETYDAHLDAVTSDGERLELLGKLGDLRREHLRDLDGAMDAYRRALTLDTAHRASRTALEKLLDADDPTARREAAAVLHPIYETDGEHERLLRVLEIEVSASEDPLERVGSLEKAMQIAEVSLTDSNRAYGYAERAVREAAGHTELTPWLDHLERLASATERHSDYVKLLCETVPNIFDGDVQMSVTLKIAELARHKLADRELAREYYEKALELRPEERRALMALETLYDEAGDPKSLLGVLERRVDNAENDDEKKTLLYRRAKLLAEVLQDRGQAIAAYEAILDLSLEDDAIVALEGLYSSEQRWQELVDLYRRELDAGRGDPADLFVKIARVLHTKMNDTTRAFDELEEALGRERLHAGAISELEQLMASAAEAEHRARAAAILEPVYLSRADFGRVMESITHRLEYTQDLDERRELLSRLAQLYEEQKEDYVAALETVAKLFHDDIADESSFSELERLAKVAGAEKRLAEIYASELSAITGDDDTSARIAKRAGELFAALGENDRGLEFFRRALVVDPESRELFDDIDAILKRTQRHDERVEHYRAALDHRFEPSERLAALHTIAELQRRELADVDSAIESYRSALDVDERDERTLDALTELYRERERWADLAELTLRRADNSLDPAAGAPHRLALARLYKNEIGDAERAVDQLEEIVRGIPSHTAAIGELEALLENSALKERVVEILGPLYEGADDWRRLIRLNEDRYALADAPAEKVAVLRETGRLWEERGNDPQRACKALRIAFALDPDDSDLRTELDRLTEVTGTWDRLTQAYEDALEKHPDMLSKRDVLARLAEVHDQRRDDPRAALNAYERLREVDETDLEVLAKMEPLATLLSDWPVLVRVLTSKAEYVLDDEERASLWRRVGEAKRDMLEDRPGAIEAYERALELDPESAFTVDCLIELREGVNQPDVLAELYQRRVELAGPDDEELKYDLLLRAAGVAEQQLSDRRRAIELLSQALGVRAGDRAVLTSLDRLYRVEEMWPELLDNLRLEASQAESTDERARLRREIGGLLSGKLNSHDDALEAYRLVLDEAPRDSETVTRVFALGRENEEHREVVASILVPVLRTTEQWEQLVEALEMRLTIENDPHQRGETLKEIAEVFDVRLSRAGDAQGALLRALSERPEESSLHGEIERLSAASGRWQAYADSLNERAMSTFEPDVAKDLWSRLGRVAEDFLGDAARAIDAYEHAVEQAGDLPELLEALDRLHGKVGNSQELAEIIERRIAIEGSDATQAELYHRLGVIQAKDFSEPARALGSFKSALERSPDHAAAAEELEKLTSDRDLFEEAAEALESVYRASQKTDRLAALYEKRVGFADSPGERIDMRRSLAKVLEEDCSDQAAALRVLEQGLVDDPTDSALLEEIERLAGATSSFAGAANALRSAIDQKNDLMPDVARDLLVRVATWQRDRMQDGNAAEASLLRALEFDAQSDEVLVLLEQLQQAPGRERDLVATLRRRAKLQLDDQRREDLYRDARRLSAEANDAELGESILRELLELDESNGWALTELTDLREAAGDYQEAFKLLVRRADLAADGGSVRDLRHRAATLAREKLGKPKEAIAIFQQLFEDDPQDMASATALRELYAAGKSWQDLGRLLERLIDLAESPSARGDLRMELARLNVDQFQALDAAVELARTILEEEEGRSDAVVFLSELYEKAGRDEELAELLTQQIAAAKARGDTAAELEFDVRLGEIYETRLGDRARAIETYRAVLARDDRHGAALEALARLYQADSNLPEAASILDRLLSLAEGAEAVRLSIALADVHEKIGDKGHAIAALERGLAVDKANADLRTRLAKLYESESQWEKLANHLGEDAELTEGVDAKVKLLKRAADIHEHKRSDPAAAAATLEKASGLKPDDRELLLELCDAYSASGRGKDAAAVLEKIVESYGGKRSKELAEIHRRLAAAHLAENNSQKAMEELDKAFRIEPGNVHVLKQLGLVSLELNDTKKAMQMFRALLLQKLEANAPITKAEVFYYLGVVHNKMGEKAKAIQMVERAIQTDAGLASAKQLLAELKG
jgi:tetratricopeptide (TPR) repeat protein